MKAFMLLFAIALPGSVAAQDTIPKFTVKATTDRPLTFRVETHGSWVRVVEAAGITVRHDGSTRLVDIVAPATLDVGGEGALEIRLLAPDSTMMEVSPVPNALADGRSVFIRGKTIILRRSAGRRQLSLIHSDQTFIRGRN
jgi:hypothetical protein